MRFLSGEFGSTSAGYGGGSANSIKGVGLAGENVNKSDLVQITPDGKSYLVRNADNAAVANKTGTIIPETTVKATHSNTYDRSPVIKLDDTGDILTLTSYSTGTSGSGLVIYKYDSGGNLIDFNEVDKSTSGAVLRNPKIRKLSNGNLLITWSISLIELRFMIMDPYTLDIIKSDTQIGTITSNDRYDVTDLENGGFMICYLSSDGDQQLAVYDNVGDVVLAPEAKQIWAGAAGVVSTQLQKLSDGNVAVVCLSKFVSTKGLYIGIYNQIGAQVLAMTNIETTDGGLHSVETSSLNGYFAVAYRYVTSDLKTYVFNNAGALQNTHIRTYTHGIYQMSFKILADQSNFYLFLAEGNQSAIYVAMLDVAGVLVSERKVTIAYTVEGIYSDAFLHRDCIVFAYREALQPKKCMYTVVETDTLLVKTQPTEFGSLPTSSGEKMAIIPCDDFSFAAAYENVSPSATNLISVKYEDTAIQGVAETSAAKGAVFVVGQGAGAQRINAISGTSPVAFDMTETNIKGNAGTLTKNSVVLGGFK
ncbi:hypothetical protein SAMN05216326_12744 [Nitrosomonas marina]|uniref:Uncharacterized protein n=1 Tax=Nitrosomonas marina TaxID=917 RepID=A0A1I0EHM5_9PROT|nr:hypothetical protein [Nitrosomonas marina]SET44681.1 hypothetical protein SAMN05216326_12744 [Nitrosomonas marina]